MSAAQVQTVFDGVIKSMERAARELAHIDQEQAAAMAKDALYIARRRELLLRAMQRVENDNA